MSGLQTRPVIVTGCSGFIGTNLAIALAARGDRVIGVEAPWAVDWRTRNLPGIEIVRLDLCREAEVRAFIEQAEPLGIFNCAAYGAYSVQCDARRMLEVNWLALRHLLDAVRHVPDFQA